MQHAGRSAYTVHLVYTRLGSVVGSRNSQLQPLHSSAARVLVCWLLQCRRARMGRGHRPMQRNHRACSQLFLLQHAPPRAAVPPCSRTHAGQPAHLRRKTRPVEIPIFFSCVRCWLVRDAREQSHVQGQLVNVPVPAHRLPVPPREVEKLAIGRQRRDQTIHGLGPQMVGVVTRVWRTWMDLIEIEFRQSSHEFSI